MLFLLISGGCCAASMVLAVLCLFCINEKNLPFWERFCRNRTAGVLLGALDLIMFLPNVKPMFSLENNLFWLIPAEAVLLWFCWKYLDHLLARAYAGALILLAHYILWASHAADLKGSSFVALFCLIFGTIAIFIGAKPWLLRDWCRKIASSFIWRLSSAVLYFLTGVALLVELIQLFGRGK